MDAWGHSGVEAKQNGMKRDYRSRSHQQRFCRERPLHEIRQMVELIKPFENGIAISVPLGSVGASRDVVCLVMPTSPSTTFREDKPVHKKRHIPSEDGEVVYRRSTKRLLCLALSHKSGSTRQISSFRCL
jgi:hypothetical protein